MKFDILSRAGNLSHHRRQNVSDSVDLVDEILDLIVSRGVSVVDAMAALSSLLVALSVQIQTVHPEADPVMGISSLSRRMVQQVKDLTGRAGGSA